MKYRIDISSSAVFCQVGWLHNKGEVPEVILLLCVINAKKHSLSHQLTAQLHIENSKNKKMVITLLQHIFAVFDV